MHNCAILSSDLNRLAILKIKTLKYHYALGQVFIHQFALLILLWWKTLSHAFYLLYFYESCLQVDSNWYPSGTFWAHLIWAFVKLCLKFVKLCCKVNTEHDPVSDWAFLKQKKNPHVAFTQVACKIALGLW